MSPKRLKRDRLSGTRSLGGIHHGAQPFCCNTTPNTSPQPTRSPERLQSPCHAAAIHTLVKVRAVGWQVEQRCTARLNQRLDRGTLVGRQAVHHDHIARQQRRPEHLANVGAEDLGGHGAVEHQRRDDPVPWQTGDKGAGFPMPMRDRRPTGLAARATAVAPGHVGGGPGFVEKDQAPELQPWLVGAPGRACGDQVGAVLLDRVLRLYGMARPSRPGAGLLREQRRRPWARQRLRYSASTSASTAAAWQGWTPRARLSSGAG